MLGEKMKRQWKTSMGLKADVKKLTTKEDVEELFAPFLKKLREEGIDYSLYIEHLVDSDR